MKIYFYILSLLILSTFATNIDNIGSMQCRKLKLKEKKSIIYTEYNLDNTQHQLIDSILIKFMFDVIDNTFINLYKCNKIDTSSQTIISNLSFSIKYLDNLCITFNQDNMNGINNMNNDLKILKFRHDILEYKDIPFDKINECKVSIQFSNDAYNYETTTIANVIRHGDSICIKDIQFIQ